MIELKPCPFCGGEARTVLTITPSGKEYSLVLCTRCHSKSSDYTTKEKAIEAWNRRVDDGKAD